MLNNISWTDYLIVVAILITIYYVFVGVRYFYGDIAEVLSGKRKVRLQTNLPDEPEHERSPSSQDVHHIDTNAFEATTDDEFEEVEHLIERLKTVITDASAIKANPEELKGYLHLIFQEYPGIKKSTIRFAINELVESECEKHGAVSLSQDDVEMLWSEPS